MLRNPIHKARKQCAGCNANAHNVASLVGDLNVGKHKIHTKMEL